MSEVTSGRGRAARGLIARCYPRGGADCPDEAKVRSDLGAQYHQSDRWEEAVVELRRAVELGHKRVR